MTPTTLVTGGAGFLGSHLCDRLIADGLDVLCLDNFYTGGKDNIRHMLGHPRFELIRHDVCLPLYVEVDRIYNLACPASPIHYQNDPIATTKTSVVGAINMLGLAKRRHARILQASTSAVAGNQVTFTASAGGVVTALTDSGTGASGAAIAVTTPGANTTAIAGTLETLTGGTGHDTSRSTRET